MKNKILYILVLLIISFSLHLIWENLHVPLYTIYENFSQSFWLCFQSTIGDVWITFLFAIFWLLVKKDFPNSKEDYFFLALFGLFIAIMIEQRALLEHKWAYTSMMPIIPFFPSGLSPILQMTALLPLSFYLANKIIKIKKYV